MKADVYGLQPPAPNTPRAIGLALVRHAYRIDFSKVMRSSDRAHLAVLAELRDSTKPHPVTLRTVPPEVTTEDVRRDPNWMFATIGVVSNRERVFYNYHQALRWARLMNVPLIRWRLRFKGRKAASLSKEEVHAFYENEIGTWHYFVQGAPAICLENVKRCNKGVVNGARGSYHSLSWFDKERKFADEATALVNGGGFRIVTLTEQQRPTTVNVRLARPTDAPAWLESDTLVRGEVVVPIELTGNDLELQPVSSASMIAGLPTVSVEWHPVDLAFALTDHKLQGATLQYLVLSLAERAFLPRHDMNGYYVFMSRTTSGAGLRRLSAPQGALAHLSRLSYTRELKLFEAGWVAEPCCPWLRVWDPEAAKAALAIMEQKDGGPKKRNKPVQLGLEAKRARMAAKAKVDVLLANPDNAKRAPLSKPSFQAVPVVNAPVPSPTLRPATPPSPSPSRSPSILRWASPYTFFPGASSRLTRRVALRPSVEPHQAALLERNIWPRGGSRLDVVLCSNDGCMGKLELTREHFARLHPPKCLNDELINYASQMILGEMGDRCFHIAQTCALEKAPNGCAQETARWFRFDKLRVHLLSLDRLYLPLRLHSSAAFGGHDIGH